MVLFWCDSPRTCPGYYGSQNYSLSREVFASASQAMPSDVDEASKDKFWLYCDVIMERMSTLHRTRMIFSRSRRRA